MMTTESTEPMIGTVLASKSLKLGSTTTTSAQSENEANHQTTKPQIMNSNANIVKVIDILEKPISN